jgi:hypothetical protein
MEQTERTPHNLTLPGTTARDKGILANEAIKGRGYYFTNKDGNLSYAKVLKYRKEDFDIEIDGVKFVWPNQKRVLERVSKHVLFYFSPEEAVDGMVEAQKETAVRKLQYFRQSVEDSIQTFDKNIKDFGKELATTNHPASTLEWSARVFVWATQLPVWREALRRFDIGMTTAEILDYFRDQLITKARHGSSRSTSPTHNLVAEFEISALGEFIDTFKYYEN